MSFASLDWRGLPLVAYYFNIVTPISTPAKSTGSSRYAPLVPDLQTLSSMLLAWCAPVAETFQSRRLALHAIGSCGTSRWFAPLARRLLLHFSTNLAHVSCVFILLCCRSRPVGCSRKDGRNVEKFSPSLRTDQSFGGRRRGTMPGPPKC